VKQQKPSPTPTSFKTLLDRLESLGRGDSLYANALRKGLAEEKERPGMGRASFMTTLTPPEDRNERPPKKESNDG
jgi:hypothetical protein